MLDWVAVSRETAHDETLVERATHDLLSPVTSILGLGETIRARAGELGVETLRAFGDSIARQARRMEAAVRDLALASRLLREGTPVVREEVHLAELLEMVSGERIRVEVANRISVRADLRLLADALRRLVANAVEFSSEEVVVRALGAPDRVSIEVVDLGVGFTEGGLRTAFEPIAGAGANVRRERGPGLGLGLFIARRSVELQGGTLEAESVAGAGSTFRIVLPR